MVSSGATGYDRKVWESLSHFYSVDAWLPRNYMLINSDVWSGVSDANKNVINACAGMAEYAGTWRAKEYTGFTLAGLAVGGMTVGPAGDTLMSGLKDVGATMTAEWLEAAGDTGQAIVDAFKANCTIASRPVPLGLACFPLRGGQTHDRTLARAAPRP